MKKQDVYLFDESTSNLSLLERSWRAVESHDFYSTGHEYRKDEYAEGFKEVKVNFYRCHHCNQKVADWGYKYVVAYNMSCPLNREEQVIRGIIV